ncbi:MAG: sugar ABC transporter permease, partial [Defluviitaleaceae bacterium]|nr:sugar ABC transporter permease [Defluviitaleaceae bacterium]
PVIIATGPVMNELISEGVATVPAVNTAAVGAALSFLPPMVANPIIGLFAQLIMVLWNSGVQILIFLAALQKLSPEQYEAAKIDGGSAWECFWKITMPAIMPMIFLNVVYTVVWLANSEQNPVINIIVSRMFAGPMAAGGMPGGYGHASAQAWVYSVVILLILGLCWALLHERKEKPKKEVKWLAKSNLPQRREVVQRVDLHKSATQTQIPETQEIPEKKEVDQ